MMGLRELATRHWRALSLDLHLQDIPIPARSSIALYVFHLLGTLAIVRLTHQPLWLALIPILAIQPLAVSLRTNRRYWLPESMAPLLMAYAVLALRLLVAVAARVLGLTSGSLVVPQPWGAALNLNLATGACAPWILVAQAGPTTEALGRRAQPARAWPPG